MTQKELSKRCALACDDLYEISQAFFDMGWERHANVILQEAGYLSIYAEQLKHWEKNETHQHQ